MDRGEPVDQSGQHGDGVGGDAVPVDALLERYGALTWSMARRWLPSDQQAAEAVCDVFARLWQWPESVDAAGCGSEALGVAIVARRVLAATLEGPPASSMPDGAPMAPSVAAQPVLPGAARGLQGLSDEVRQTLWLVVLAGRGGEAVAMLTGRSGAAVRADLSTALAALDEGLAADGLELPGDPGEASERAAARLAAHPRQANAPGAAAGADEAAAERGAAAAELCLGQEAALPRWLRERLMDQWRRAPGVTAPRAEPAARPGGERVRLGGYWLAGAGLLLALIGWWPEMAERLREPEGPQARMEAMLAESDDVVTAPWQSTDDPAAGSASGRVVWSSERQRGFLVFDGLAPNNPAEQQYQLWIFEQGDRRRHPVDGGLFNVPARGDSPLVVPIEPKLPVERPKLFAVTVEPPGGVVVSDQDRVVATAKPDDG